jgi:hypothetical protein
MGTSTLGSPRHFTIGGGPGKGGAARERKRGDGDVLRLVFQHLEPSQAARLKGLLAEHLRGFREAFGARPQSRTA